jgi:hypothetical protein
LRRLVKDEDKWDVVAVELHRLRNSSPQKWYYVVEFEPIDERKSLENHVSVLVDCSGRAGKFDDPNEPGLKR